MISIVFAESIEKGALCILVADGNSVLLALDRNVSIGYRLPKLSHGNYRVLVYDIEQNGTLPNGVVYPAITTSISFNDSGKAAHNI